MAYEMETRISPGRRDLIGTPVDLGDGQLSYVLTRPEPDRDLLSKDLLFEDHPSFRPNLTPREILVGGCFGGAYFRPWYSSKLRRMLSDDWRDLPREWYEGLDVGEMLTRSEPIASANKWNCLVGQSLDEWEKQGWTAPEHDPRGWFQWYCRFFRGRRCADDARQVERWTKIASESSGRWRRILYGKYLQARQHEVLPSVDLVSPAIRQTLRHWAYEITTEHLTAFREEKGQNVANDDHDMRQ